VLVSHARARASGSARPSRPVPRPVPHPAGRVPERATLAGWTVDVC